MKYLSDVLDVSLFEKGVMNVIYDPCGCGKTTCAINTIAPLASSPKKAIYLIDTRLGKERLGLLPELTTPYVCYSEAIANDSGFFENDKEVVVTTYAQFGVWCDRYPGFAEKYEYIICDEPHNLVLFSEMGQKDKRDIPYHKIARAAIEAAVNNGMAGAVMDRFGSRIMMMREDDAHFRITVNVAVSGQFFGWVFGLGKKARIIAPESVKEQMKNELAAVMERYRT